MTEVCDRTLRAGGPALLFQNPTGHSMPVLGNLFGTQRRVALGMGADSVSELRKIGHVLSRLKEPEPPKDFKDLMGLGSLVKAVWDMAPKELRGAKCQDRMGRRRCRFVAPADPALLAGRRGAADYLGPGDYQGP
jgi:4-hydroxy-3-polyprenylbenzoate decarboxylase